VPGVMNKKIIICKYRKYSRGSIFDDSPKKPGAKDGKIGLSKMTISQSSEFSLKLFIIIVEFFKKKSHRPYSD